MSSLFTRAALLLSTAIGIGLGAATPSFAQNDANTIGEVVVTARRMAERLQDVPISITVFNQEQLNQRNITYPGDLATYTPSLSANTQFGVDNTQFSLRGFTQQLQTSPTVGVYFADVVAPRGGPTIATGDGAGPGDFFDLQNIQVLKGPQGTLFGRNTTGGAVLLVPQKPTGKYEGYIEGSLGNFGLKRVQAVVNIPANDQLRFRFGVDREKRDGYTHNISGIGPEDFNNIDYTALRASVVWDITPELQNYSIFSYTNSTTHGAEAQMYLCNGAASPATSYNISGRFNPVSGKPFTAASVPGLPNLACGQIAQQLASGDPYAIENNQIDPHSSLHQWQLINTTTWDATSWLTVKNIISYARLKNSYQSNLFGDNFTIPASLPLFPGVALPTGAFAGTPLQFVSVDSPPGNNIADQSTFTEELQFQGHNFDNRLTWQAGAYLEISRPAGPNYNRSATIINCADIYTLQCTDTLGTLFGLPGRFGQVTDKPDAIDYRNLAGYAQATWKFNDQWKATGGVRYTSDRTRSWARVTNFFFPAPNTPFPTCQSTLTTLAQGCFTGFEESSAKPTWLIDLDYTPRTDMLVYAKYARGYRQGDVNPVAADGFQTWGPETVDNYEIGTKTTFDAPIPFTFDVAAFYNNFSNQQIFVGFQGPAPAVPNSSVINAGKSRIWGIEVETVAQPIHNLTIDIAYTYLNSKLESLSLPTLAAGSVYNVITPSSLPGDPMQYTPKHKGTATINYTLPVAEDLGRFTIGGTYVYTDPQLVERDNPFGTIPATSLLSFHAEWTNMFQKPVDLSFFMTNATNKFYWSSMVDLTESAGWATRTLAEPRMYGFRLRYHFGT
jgi:iron complex outermembrane receptor protein